MTPSPLKTGTPASSCRGSVAPGGAGEGWRVAALLTGIGLLWFLSVALTHRTPDLDSTEELVWAASLEWGYYKHPPLPSWLMHGLVALLGRHVWLPFAAGMSLTMLALWFIWRLARDLLPAGPALTVVLLTSLQAYFSMRGVIYNHNTVQLWSIAAATWLCWRALQTQHLLLWALLGGVSALAMLTKYSAVIQFGAFGLYMLSSGALRKAHTWRGLAVAGAVFLVCLAPHVAWLVAHDFLPLHYANQSLHTDGHAAALMQLVNFNLDQVARLSPMLIAWLFWWWRHGRHTAHDTATPAHAALIPGEGRRFLLWVGLAPLLGSVAVAAVLGTWLSPSWATTFFILWGFYFLWWTRGDLAATTRQVTTIVLVLHVVMAIGYGLGRGPIAWYAGHPSRPTFPGAQASHALQAHWKQHLPQLPLRVVASDTWLGGNIAIHADAQTHVLINGDPALSPWLNSDTALSCGVLVVYSHATRGSPHPALIALREQARWQGVEQLRWSSARSPWVDLNWGILPPTPDCPEHEHP